MISVSNQKQKSHCYIEPTIASTADIACYCEQFRYSDVIYILRALSLLFVILVFPLQRPFSLISIPVTKQDNHHHVLLLPFPQYNAHEFKTPVLNFGIESFSHSGPSPSFPSCQTSL